MGSHLPGRVRIRLDQRLMPCADRPHRTRRRLERPGHLRLGCGVLLLTVAAGCDPETQDTTQDAAAAITLTDAAGRSLTLPQPARRVVSLVPSVTATLHAIGADGVIYLVTADRWVRAIDPDGGLKWRYRAPARLKLFGERGMAAVKLIWKSRFGIRQHVLHGPPVLSDDGMLYVNFGHNGTIHAFDVRRK